MPSTPRRAGKPASKPRVVGSPNDIVIYDGVPHSRAYAMAEMSRTRVPTAWVERFMAETPVVFAQPKGGPAVHAPQDLFVSFANYKPCHDEKGHFAPCGSEAAARGEKAKVERAEKQVKEKEAKVKAKSEKAEAKQKAAEEKAKNKVVEAAQKKETRKKLKVVKSEIEAISKEKSFPPEKGAPTVPHGPPTPTQARVGVGAFDMPPPPKVPRLKNLTADERVVEERFAHFFESNPDKVAADFTAAVFVNQAQAIEEGKVRYKDPEYTTCPTFEMDEAKLMCPDYDPKDVSKDETKAAKGLYNIATHQTANAIAKKAFSKYLEDVVSKMPEDKRRVIVTSGGCGSGKGFGVSQGLGYKVTGQYAACWDAAGEQNATENAWVQQECEKHGIRPTFVFVHADPTKTWEDKEKGVVQRAGLKGRMVDARLFADSFTEGAKNFQDFMSKNKDSGKADFLLVNNDRYKPDGKPDMPVPMDKIPDSALNIDGDALYARASNFIAASPDLTPAIRRGASVGKRVFG